MLFEVTEVVGMGWETLLVCEGPTTASSREDEDDCTAGGGAVSPCLPEDSSLGIGARCNIPTKDSALCSDASGSLSDAAREEWWEYRTGMTGTSHGLQYCY